MSQSLTRSLPLSELQSLLGLAEAEKAKRDIARQTGEPSAIWTPFSGPQTRALLSEADILFYGGAAGGGKTDLLIGTAATQHRNSIIFRRDAGQLKGILDRADELFTGRGSYSGRYSTWRLDNGRRIEFGSSLLPKDVQKYQGRPHDLKAFDELPHFTEAQFRFLIGWNRSPDPHQRVRVIAAGNPPTTAEGDWVNKYWGPWLDPTDPRPALDGELRWFARLRDSRGRSEDVQVDGPEPIEVPGEPDPVIPQSRTFIRARVQDNPVYMATGYIATLQALPEPLRSLMLFGDFQAGQDDHPWQVIPTAWVIAAQKRWQEAGGQIPRDARKRPIPMDTIGVDVARGGADETVYSPRHGVWFAEQIAEAGSATPDGKSVIQGALRIKTDNARLQIDAIGVGSSPIDIAKEYAGLRVFACNASRKSLRRDRTRKYGFVNARADWWWSLREDLDPDLGAGLMLPPDRRLRADLTSARYEIKPAGIQIEAKEDIKARIGRSPDRGEALVYAHAQPPEPPDWADQSNSPSLPIFKR